VLFSDNREIFVNSKDQETLTNIAWETIGYSKAEK
jgi:hypothetical protein